MVGKRIFVDVGAHFGQSAEIALNPRYKMDEVHCYEPSAVCVKQLGRIFDQRLTIHHFGLGEKDFETDLYFAGELGASIFPNKRQNLAPSSLHVERISIRDASRELVFLKNRENSYFLKINCEGAEISVLRSLLKSGLIQKHVSLYVDFDIKKVPGLENQASQIEKILQDEGVDYLTSDLLFATGPKAVSLWLDKIIRPEPVGLSRSLHYRFNLHLDWKLRLYRVLAFVFPKSLKSRIFPFIRNLKVVMWFRYGGAPEN